MLPEEAATTTMLEALRNLGAAAAIVVGELAPRPAPRPIRGLLVVRVRPQAAVQLTGGTWPMLEDRLRRHDPTMQPLQRPFVVTVDAQAPPVTGAINVMAYLPGKHPKRSRELVVVCTDLDALGVFSGVSTLDAAHLGVSTAALLEVARQYASFARFGTMPERSLLFAVFSGARLDYTGLREYLQHPLWALDKTRAFVYMGLDAADEPAVRTLLASKDLPLYVIPTRPDTLGTDRLYLLPDRRPARSRTIRSAEDEDYRRDPPRLSDLIDRGVIKARTLAEDAHAVLLRETVTGPALLPIAADTLRIPISNEQE